MSPEDQSQQKTLPKEAIEWMIAFLNAKKDPNCAGENRSLSSKPYSGIPTYVNNRIEISRKLDLFTGMSVVFFDLNSLYVLYLISISHNEFVNC